MTTRTQPNLTRAGLRWLVHAAFASVLAASGAAHGAPAGEPIIVLNARVGSSAPNEIDHITPLLDDELEARGFAAKPSTIARILGGRIPRPGILDPGLTVADIIHPIELGYDDWAQGLFAEAEKKLVPAIAKVNRNPALLVADTKNLDATFKALVALALSQSKLGQASQSAETMTNLIRVFRTRPISRAEYGPPAEQLYRTIAKQILASGTGQLYVTTGNEQAVVFVDGQIRGIGKAAVADVISGQHHVFIQVPATAGLQYEVEVRANEDTNLNVVWDVDTAVKVTEPWIGLVFTTEAERGKEAMFAGELARRWGGQGVIAVVGTLQLQGRPALIGTIYRAGGTIFRSAVTTLDGDRVTNIRSLAKYLADGTVSPELNVIPNGGKEPVRVLAARASLGPPTATAPAKAVGAAGLLAITTGGVLYVTGHPDGSVLEDRRTVAVQVVVGGSVVLGAGTYLWLREARSTSRLTAAVVGAGASALIAGGVLYFTDEDPRSDSRYYRNTERTGLVVGTAGLAMTGIGLWLLHREGKEAGTSGGSEAARRHRASTPIVAAGPGRALLGWAGSF
jgi:hypothetical protein